MSRREMSIRVPGGVLICAVTMGVLFLGAPALAYEQYSVNKDATNCRACHGDFRSNAYISPSDGQNWGNLHDLHRSDMLNGDCDTCHSSGRFPVFLGSSAGGDGLPAYSCAGCHGREEDFSAVAAKGSPGRAGRAYRKLLRSSLAMADRQRPSRGLDDTDRVALSPLLSSGFGAGLRQRHWRGNVRVCLDCHTDADPNSKQPAGEHVLPPYYAMPGTNHPDMPTDSCNPAPAFVEDFAGLMRGLDNDGDLDYDEMDSDCVPAVCGDGTVGAGEECDDGNTLPGDCCSPTCTFEASGMACNDGAFCNVGETCDGAGSCGGGAPRSCADALSCTADSCDEVADACVNDPVDAACDDGVFCNGAERCDVVLDCRPGTPIDCSDGVSCTVDSCDEAGDACVNLADDGLCDDGAFCNGSETCDAALDCRPGTPVDCGDGVSCTVDSCDEAGDACMNLADDGLCDDGAFCNGSERCDAALDCRPGTPVDCGDGVSCTVDSCDEANDACLNAPVATTCSNGVFCDGAELCDPVLDCQPGTPPTCADANICTDDACNLTTDMCENIFDPGNDPSCAGGCGNGSLDAGEDCDDGNTSAGDCCSPTCMFETSGSTCDDGAFCNVGETCDGAGACVGGAARDCGDGVSCTSDACDEAADACVNVADSGTCDDGAFCNGAETCDPALDCIPGLPVDCNDGVACTTDACDEASDACVNSPSDAACDDLAYCNGVETCSATLGCQPGTAVDCADAVSCTTDACDEASDSCVHAADDGLCADGLFCNGTETCDPGTGCQAGLPVTCDDGVSCTADSCDEAGDSCVHLVDDIACDDGAWCNGEEFCDAVLDCRSGAPPGCDDSDICTDDMCDETGDMCENVFDPNNDPSCASLCEDLDEDGFSGSGGPCGEIDCDDEDPEVYPGATERCDDDKDNDCNALLDAADDACPFDGSIGVRSGPLQDPRYAGSVACGECHENHYDQWRNTLHARMLIRPADAQAAGFALPPFDPNVGVEIRSWSDALFVIGQKWKTRFVDREGMLQGRQWNYRFGRWDPYGGNQRTPYDCGGCHTTGYDPNAVFEDDHGQPVSGIVGSWVEYSVGCEACHGPGAEHAGAPDRSNINRIAFDWYDPDDDGTPNPVPIRSALVCGNCHFRTDRETIQRDRRSREQFNDWQAGPHAASIEPTSISTFCAKCHSPGDADYHASEYNFTYFDTATATHVACISCHNPHQTSSPRWSTLTFPPVGRQNPLSEPATVARYLGTDGNAFTVDFESFEGRGTNALCRDCHRLDAAGLRRHRDAREPEFVNLAPPFNGGEIFVVPHREHVELGNADCVDCHMPASRRSINAGDVRSHSFWPNEWRVDPTLSLPHFDETCGQCHPEAESCTWCHSESFSGLGPGSGQSPDGPRGALPAMGLGVLLVPLLMAVRAGLVRSGAAGSAARAPSADPAPSRRPLTR